MSVLEGYVDQRKVDEHIFNVGVYPLFNAMTEALNLHFGPLGANLSYF